jgi:hypothetical protein
MIDKLGLTSDIEFDLKYGPEEIKNRIENLKLETNILRTSLRKRQLGLLIKQIEFINKNDFEIIKKGDPFGPFKSGRGKITARISVMENETSELKCTVKSRYSELLMNLLTLGIIILTLIFGNPESKYYIALGMVGFLVLTLFVQVLFLRLNLTNLKNELIELIDMIK